MQILTPELATVLSALLTIYVGIVVEKHYVSWSSVYTNTLSLFVLLASADLPVEVLLLLFTYTALGYLSVKMRWNRVFPLFGCKTYGSLVLVITLGSQGLIFGIYTPLSVLISWVLVAAVVHYIGYMYKMKRKRRRR